MTILFYSGEKDLKETHLAGAKQYKMSFGMFDIILYNFSKPFPILEAGL